MVEDQASASPQSRAWLELLGLGADGKVGVASLASTLKEGSSASKRAAAASALGELGCLAGSLGAIALAEALRKDDSVVVRRSAAEALGCFGDSPIFEAQAGALAFSAASDPDREVRWAALRVLKLRRLSLGTVPAILTSTMVQDGQGLRCGRAVAGVCRSAAALALGVLGTKAGEVGALEYAQHLLESGSSDVRRGSGFAADWLLREDVHGVARSAQSRSASNRAASHKVRCRQARLLQGILQHSVADVMAQQFVAEQRQASAEASTKVRDVHDDELLGALLADPCEPVADEPLTEVAAGFSGEADLLLLQRLLGLPSAT